MRAFFHRLKTAIAEFFAVDPADEHDVVDWHFAGCPMPSPAPSDYAPPTSEKPL